MRIHDPEMFGSDGDSYMRTCFCLHVCELRRMLEVDGAIMEGGGQVSIGR